MSKKNPPWYIPIPEPKLQIKVGHRYRTRSGDVVEIVGEKKYTHAPKLYEGKFLTRQIPSLQFYIVTGRWGLQESEYDLIEELPADVAAP
jgi:hypothetical protein